MLLTYKYLFSFTLNWMTVKFFHKVCTEDDLTKCKISQTHDLTEKRNK